MKILKADPDYRRNTIIFIVLVAAVWTLAYLGGLLDADVFSAWLNGGHPEERILLALRTVFIPLVPFGIYLIHLGSKIIRSREFPPPGTKLIKDTEVKTGVRALLYGYGLLASGLVLLVLFWYGAFVVPNQLEGMIEDRKPAVESSASPGRGQCPPQRPDAPRVPARRSGRA